MQFKYSSPIGFNATLIYKFRNLEIKFKKPYCESCFIMNIFKIVFEVELRSNWGRLPKNRKILKMYK